MFLAMDVEAEGDGELIKQILVKHFELRVEGLKLAAYLAHHGCDLRRQLLCLALLSSFVEVLAEC